MNIITKTILTKTIISKTIISNKIPRYVLLSCITPCVPVMMLRMHAREKYNIEV